MSDIFQRARTSLAERLQRYRNKPFLEAMMAATSLLAFADEKVELSERLALDYILENVTELKVYDVHKAINLFNGYGKAMQENFAKTKEKVLATIGNFAGDEQTGLRHKQQGRPISVPFGNREAEINVLAQPLIMELFNGKLCKSGRAARSSSVCSGHKNIQ